jgi:PAS domain S-box-containing protein
MGRLIRAHPWQHTSLGPPQQWPPTLRTALSMILRSGYPMFIWWGEALTCFHNDAYLPVLGKKHPEALGKSAREVWSEIWDEVGPLARNVFTGRTTYMQDLPLYLHRKGFSEETYWTFSYSPILLESGEVGGLLCACNEETGKIVGQRRLRTLQEITGLSLEHKTVEEVGWSAVEAMGKNPNDFPFALLYLLNEAGDELTLINSVGLSGGVAPRLPMGSAAPWELHSLLEQRIALVTEAIPLGAAHSGTNGAFVMPLQRSSADTLTGVLICGLSPYLDFENGYSRFLLATATQVTGVMAEVKAFDAEHQRAEERAKAEKDLQNLFMQAPVGILILEGASYRVKLVNDAYLPIVQRSREALLGKNIFEALPEVANQGFREILDEVRRTGTPYHHREYRTLLHRHGREETTYLNVVYQPLRERDGSTSQVMVLVHEVTDQVLARKRMEEITQTLEVEVNERTRDLRQANQELERSNKELEQFAYAASHDMKEPLRKIQTFATFLTDETRPPEMQRSFITKIQESAKRMSMIIDDLLNYSYQGGERLMVDIDLNKTIQDVRYDLELLINQKGALIEQDPLPVLPGIPTQLHQLFFNLLNNALKFAKPGEPPRIRISCRTVALPGREGSFAEIVVIDNGIGFEQEYAEKIFQLFTRLNDRQAYAGSGIGLALCKKIVAIHQGEIRANSQPGQGTRFTIHLPMQEIARS